MFNEINHQYSCYKNQELLWLPSDTSWGHRHNLETRYQELLDNDWINKQIVYKNMQKFMSKSVPNRRRIGPMGRMGRCLVKYFKPLNLFTIRNINEMELPSFIFVR